MAFTYYSTTSVAYQMELYLEDTDVNVSANTSKIKWALYLKRTNSSYSAASSSSGDTFVVTINGTNVLNSSVAWDLTNSNKVTIKSGTTPAITHDADGNKSVNVSFSFTPSLSSTYYPKSMSSGTRSYPMTKIPRGTAATISKSSLEFGEEFTVDVSAKAVSTYSHGVYYRLNAGDWVWLGRIESSLTSKTFSIPTTEISNYPRDVNIAGSVCVNTYAADGTSLNPNNGSIHKITVKVPETYKPTIDLVTVKDTATKPSTMSSYWIKGISKPTVTVTASGSEGSTISKIITTADGIQYSGSPVEIGIIQSSSVSVAVTDSRGRTTTRTVNVPGTVYSYSTPVIRNFTAQRVNSSGSLDDNGTRVKLSAAYTVTSISSKNAKTLKFEFKESSATSWTTLTTITPSSYSTTYNYSTPTSRTFSTDKAYEFRATITDSFNNASSIVSVAPVYTLINFGAGGKSIAIGGMSSDAGLFETHIPLVVQQRKYYSLYMNGYSASRLIFLGTLRLNTATQNKIPAAHININNSYGTRYEADLGPNMGATFNYTAQDYVLNMYRDPNDTNIRLLYLTIPSYYDASVELSVSSNWDFEVSNTEMSDTPTGTLVALTRYKYIPATNVTGYADGKHARYTVNGHNGVLEIANWDFTPASGNGWNNVCTIPTELAPPESVDGIMMNNSVSTPNGVVQVRLNRTGQFVAWINASNRSTTVSLKGNLSWIIKGTKS